MHSQSITVWTPSLDSFSFALELLLFALDKLSTDFFAFFSLAYLPQLYFFLVRLVCASIMDQFPAYVWYPSSQLVPQQQRLLAHSGAIAFADVRLRMIEPKDSGSTRLNRKGNPSA
jgi:hypothetical protein